jgi:uncharacterized RDD family membrane protein YckC
MSESSAPRKPRKGAGTGKKKNAAKGAGTGPEPGQGEVLAPQGGAKKPRVVGRKGDGNARSKKVESGVAAPGGGPSDPVGSGADVQRNLFAGQPGDERSVLRDSDAMGDAPNPENLDRVDDRLGSSPFTSVDEGKEAKTPDPIVDAPELVSGDRGFVPAEAKPHRPSPGRLLVEIENAVRGRRSPLADGIEKDRDPGAGASFEGRKDGIQLIADPKPGKSDLLDDGRGDVDLGVRDALPEETAGDVASDQAVVRGKAQFEANLAVEAKEVLGAVKDEPGPDRGEIRKDRASVPGGEREERAGRDRPFEVEVQLGLGKPAEVAKEGGGPPAVFVTSVSRTSTQEIASSLLAARAFERYWLRGAALGIDLITLAGIPFLASTLVVFVILLFAGEPPRRIESVFHLAQISFAVTFLLRDVKGLSPGKRFLGLRAAGKAGARVGPLVSVLRNLPLLIPGLNFVEAILAGLDQRGRRLGDRLAGTIVVEE